MLLLHHLRDPKKRPVIFNGVVPEPLEQGAAFQKSRRKAGPPAGRIVVRGRHNPFDAIESAADLHVEPGDFFGTGKLPPLKAGVRLVDGTWRLESAPAPHPAAASTR